MTPTEQAPRAPLRIQQNVLAASERRLLNWLCARLPAWVVPDYLTALGIFGALMSFAGYWASSLDPAWLWLAIAGYGVNWFGDSLDGSLARFRRIERPSFGYFIDHSCDALGTMMILGGIGLSPYVTLSVALFTLAGYLLLSIHAFLAVKVMGEMKLSYLAFGPTELRLALIGLTLTMLALGPKPSLFAPFTGFDLVVGGVGAILVVLYVIQTLVTARKLDKIDVQNRL